MPFNVGILTSAYFSHTAFCWESSQKKYFSNTYSEPIDLNGKNNKFDNNFVFKKLNGFGFIIPRCQRDVWVGKFVNNCQVL